jgi:hypothetical protein
MTMASAGIFSPGLTSRCSPPLSVLTAISWVLPSLFSRCAVSGNQRGQFLKRLAGSHD